jgi:ribosomal protein S18 acetylase RimI-like enzyme
LRTKKATGKELKDILEIDAMTIGNDSRKNFITEAVKTGRCLAAVAPGKVVGFGILGNSLLFNREFIELLIVRPEYRRRGVAADIIKQIESMCLTDKLFTSTNESNTVAQKTFEACGFVRSGYIENLDEGDPEVIYFKRLAQPCSGGRL